VVAGAEAAALVAAVVVVGPWPGPQPVWPVGVEVEEVVAETAMPIRCQAPARKVDPWT